MKRHLVASMFSAGAVLLALVSLASGTAAGQNAATKGPAAAKNGPIPRTVWGKPDVSGVWAGPGFKHVEGAKYSDIPGAGAKFDLKLLPPLVPGGEELWNKKLTGDVRNDDPELLCLPLGFPHTATSAHAQQFVLSPDTLVILYEDMHYFRPIPLDGRPHPKDVEPTFMGNSVGHWEGDTLVIDTVGLRRWDSEGGPHHMHTDAAHYIEHFTRTGPTTMTYALTTDDPKIFTKPWTQTWVMHLHKDWQLEEDVCEDNNRDLELLDSVNKKYGGIDFHTH